MEYVSSIKGYSNTQTAKYYYIIICEVADSNLCYGDSEFLNLYINSFSRHSVLGMSYVNNSNNNVRTVLLKYIHCIAADTENIKHCCWSLNLDIKFGYV